MFKSLPVEPEWLYWATATYREIAVDRRDASQRFARVGHRRPLPLHWACSIGFWGLRSAKEIMAATTGLSDKERGAFATFKSKRGLMAKEDLIQRLRLEDPNITAPVLEHAIDIGGQSFIARYILRHLDSMPEELGPYASELGPRLGLFPVEIVAYVAETAKVLGHHGIGVDDFLDGSVREAAELWGAAKACVEYSPRNVGLRRSEQATTSGA